MAVTINASTTSGLVMTSDLSGVLTLQQNGVSLPNGGVAPAFSAYGSALQSAVTSTFTKIAYNTKIFDTNNNYDNVTNYRFTPTVSGYYQVNASMSNQGSAVGLIGVYLYKNGSLHLSVAGTTNTTSAPIIGGSGLIYMNGSTDYLEVYGYQNSGGNLNIGSNGISYQFSACLVRGA